GPTGRAPRGVRRAADDARDPGAASPAAAVAGLQHPLALVGAALGLLDGPDVRKWSLGGDAPAAGVRARRRSQPRAAPAAHGAPRSAARPGPCREPAAAGRRSPRRKVVGTPVRAGHGPATGSRPSAPSPLDRRLPGRSRLAAPPEGIARSSVM